MWGTTVPIIGAVTPMHPAPAIVVTPPGGKPPNRIEAEKHISYAEAVPRAHGPWPGGPEGFDAVNTVRQR